MITKDKKHLFDLSDPTAVNAAIAEYDSLGENRFLERYGFGPARGYWLVQNGKRYPSKAIAGVAFGIQFPDLGPLDPKRFSGGEATVQRLLERLGFEVTTEIKRNPTWSRDELVLALDFYMRWKAHLPSKESSEIQVLSEEVSAIGKYLGLSGSDNFRNPNGVYMKLMNFRRLDPEYTIEGKVGLTRGGKNDAIVWTEFASDVNRLSQAAQAIRFGFQHTNSTERIPDDEPEITDAPEGRIVTRLHRTRERNREIVKQKKRQFLKNNGFLSCEVCGFDFENTYGERGKGFIECHHIKPVHSLNEGERTRMDDLSLLCANCHRMVHSKSPWLTLDELRSVTKLHSEEPVS